MDGLKGEDSIAELCHREGIAQSLYYSWSKEFLEAGKKRLAGDTARAATSGSVAFSPDGQRIVSWSEDSTLRLWDAKTGEQIGDPLLGHENLVFSVDVSPDGQRIVSGSADSTLRLWDAETGAQIGVLRGHVGLVLSVDFSPDGSRLASASDDSTIRIWSVKSGERLNNTPVGDFGRVSSVFSIQFSPNGRSVMTGGSGGQITLLAIVLAENTA